MCVCVCVCVCVMEYYSSIKKNEVVPFAARWVDIDIVTLSEVSQTEKDKYHIPLLCGILKKNGTNESIYETEVESQM